MERKKLSASGLRGFGLPLGALAASLALASAGSGQAADGAGEATALLREKGCHACHAMTDTVLGPSYQAIAAMHGARKEVMTEVLAEKIIVGGAGNWGVVPMAANARVSREEARALAAWILEQQPG